MLSDIAEVKDKALASINTLKEAQTNALLSQESKSIDVLDKAGKEQIKQVESVVPQLDVPAESTVMKEINKVKLLQ